MNGSALRVWLIDDDASIRWVLERALRNDGMAPRAFEAAEPALDALRRESPDVLITDIRMPGASGLELLKRIHDARPQLPVIVMTAHSDLANAVSAYEGGAFEYLPKPFDIDQAIALVRRAASAGQQPGNDPGGAPRMPELLGTAPAMQQVFRAIGRLSRSSVTVLITGESGTGKELVARALHEHSPRAERPFIALNTAAIPADLLESELFGHERGAFTGADAQRRGRFEQADGGTLFLDEIGDMPLPLQTRLLRVLAEGEFYRVGGQTPMRVDVRVIAATNQSLQERVTRGLFREDLYHRLNVILIELPPLRARAEDIPDLLARTRLVHHAQALRRPQLTEGLRQLRKPRTHATHESRRSATGFGHRDRRRLRVRIQSDKTSDKLLHGLPPVLLVDHAQMRSTCGSAHASVQPTVLREADRFFSSTLNARLPMAGHDV
ncbi:MAG: nitrogen regulation protein NR(I) [Gammaproteobacteria bacterium]|nr:MAG: nitrogen regulation protein NR(I) [Gammaproteobacteria bacterium]